MRKFCILLILVLFLGIITYGFLLPWYEKKKVASKVISELRKKYEFCELERISKKDGVFHVYLICNGRPFYCEYVNGTLRFDLNGWSWLKATNYWNELKDCQLYNYENSMIYFYCLSGNRYVIKKFNFNRKGWSLEKKGEEDMEEFILRDLNKILLVDGCEITNLTAETTGYKRLFITLTCHGNMFFLFSDITISLQPPLNLDEQLSIEERMRKSIDMLGCEVLSINEKDRNATALCNGTEIIFNFHFKEKMIDYQIPIEEACSSIKFFVFPPLKDNLKLLGWKGNNTLVYLLGNRVIGAMVSGNKITRIFIKSEHY